MASFPDDDTFSSADAQGENERNDLPNRLEKDGEISDVLKRMQEDISSENAELRTFLENTGPTISMPACQSEQEIRIALLNVDKLLADISDSSLEEIPRDPQEPPPTVEHIVNVLRTCNAYLGAIEAGIQTAPEIAQSKQVLDQLQTERGTAQHALEAAQAGGMWKRLLSTRARSRATNTLNDLRPRSESARREYEGLQDTYDQHRRSYEAQRRRTQEACLEGVRRHFQTILRKEKEVFDVLTKPQQKSEWNDRLLDMHVHPVLAQVIKEGQLTKDEAETYLGLVKEILQEGFDSRVFDGGPQWEKRRVRNQKFNELSRKAYVLSDVLSNISANNRNLIGDEYYDVHLRLLINQETKKRIQREADTLSACAHDEALQQQIRECTASVINGPDEIGEKNAKHSWENADKMHKVNIENWSHTQIPMDGIERWKILKESPLLQTILSPETFGEAEKCMADKLGKGHLLAGGRESWDGTRAAAVLEEIGTPHAIPYILQLFEQSGTGHTSAAAAYHLEQLLQKIPPQEINAALASYPQDMRDTIALLQDRNKSYFARYSKDGYSVAHILQNRKRTLRQEQIAAAMERDGMSEEELENFYLLRQEKPDLLATLRKYAAAIGMQEKDLVEEYFEELTSLFSLQYAESPKLIRGIAEALGENPQDVFEKTKESFHVRVHESHKALQNICAIADAVGLKKKALVEEYLSDLLTGIYTYSEDIVEFIRDLSAALEEPPDTSLERIQPNLEGFLGNPIGFLNTLKELSVLTGIGEKELIEFRLPQFLQSITQGTVQELPDALSAPLGCTRADIMHKFAAANPHMFTVCAERNDWRALHTEKIFSDFLSALPTDTDEKRNAFTHNPYDRTSEFMTVMNNCQGFDFRNAQGMEDIAKYVKTFGLSKTGILFQYFQNLRKLERKEIEELPAEQQKDDITTLAKLEERVQQFRSLVYGEKPLMDTQHFSDFELEMLAVVTNHSAHRFGGGRQSLGNILAGFARNTEDKLITPIPPEYGVSTFTIDQVHIDFEPAKIQEDFGVLSAEILNSIEHGYDIADVRDRACALLRKNNTELEGVLEKQPQNRFIQQQLQSAQVVLAHTEKAQNIDEFIKALLNMQRAQAEKYDIASIIREALFRKFLEKNYSPAMIQNLQMTLSRGASPQGVFAIVDVVQNSIKDHVLNLEDNNQEAYWSPDCWQKILETKGKKTSLDLRMVYEGRIKALKEEAEHFRQVSTGISKKVRAIPDRGLIGEMSGYLANACYTAEYPLLVKYPNVVPIKFVSGEEGSTDVELIGSLLYFEIETESGKALLARAFNVPNEAGLDIHAFIEQNLDRAAETAKKRGCKYVIVPGVSGAISNYPLTNNHIRQNYTENKTPLKLKERFAFNNYDLTQSCYVARTIAEE